MVEYLVFAKEKENVDREKIYTNLLLILADKNKNTYIETEILEYKVITTIKRPYKDLFRILPILKKYEKVGLTIDQINKILDMGYGKNNYIIGISKHDYFYEDVVDNILLISGCETADDAKHKYLEMTKLYVNKRYEDLVCIKVSDHIHANKIKLRRYGFTREYTSDLIRKISEWN